jgi:CrcB protein
MQQIAMVFFGAGIGGVLRLLFGKFAANHFGLVFPIGTLGVNVIGGLLMGVAQVFLTKNVNNQEFVLYFVMIGVLGGFTTFSTFSLEVVKLAQNGFYADGALYICASVLLSILAVLLGMAFAKNFV